MSIRVLRRNRRTNPTHQIAGKREFALFVVSLVIFFGGMTSLAWAVHEHPQPPDNQIATSDEELRQDSALAQTYTGDIKTQRSASSSSSASASASASSSSSSATPSVSSMRQDGESTSARSTDARSSLELTQQNQNPAAAASSTADEPVAAGSESVSYHIVHHTAYQAVPVYRTVHHQASTAHEITIGGKTSIEWTKCPVCGERHDSAFNERVLDHTNESFCVACGGKHESAYDEVVCD